MTTLTFVHICFLSYQRYKFITILREFTLITILSITNVKYNEDRLKCYNPNTIKGIIEGRMKTEKYLEKKNGEKTNKWDIRTA